MQPIGELFESAGYGSDHLIALDAKSLVAASPFDAGRGLDIMTRSGPCRRSRWTFDGSLLRPRGCLYIRG
jgi:hypothetical protein